VQEIVAALDALQTGDFEARWEAAKQLEDYSEAVVSPLLAMLQESDDDAELQWFIAKILGALSHPDAIFALAQLLEQSEDEEVQSIAAQGLAKLGPDAIDTLSKSLQNPQRQIMALQALAQIHRPEVVPVLLEAANADSAEVRSHVFEALDQFIDPRIVDALLVGLSDASAEVRKTAIASLAVRTQEYPLEDLVARLIPCLEDADLGVVIQAARALGRFGTDRGATALIQKCCASNLDLVLQQALIQSLGWMGSTLALEGLLQIWQRLAQQTPLPELLLQEILSSVAGFSEAEIWIPELLQTPNAKASPVLKHSPTLKAKAMLTLGRIGSPAIIPRLIECLEDPNYTVQLHAVTALKQIDPDFAHTTIQQRIQDGNITPQLAEGLAIALREW
jgi:HEAT repeat protein